MARFGSCLSTTSSGSGPARWATTPSEASDEPKTVSDETNLTDRSAEAFRAARAGLLADSDLRGDDFSRAYTALADRWLASLLDAAGGVRGVALVAVGGYGRGDLCPGSDLDVVLVHAGSTDRQLGSLAESIWYPLWDAGIKVGHATRTVKEALTLASADLDTATALLCGRPLGGDGPLAHELTARARSQWRAGAQRWLPALAEAVQSRHDRVGEVAFLLEPDLKDGRGGLRDIHALRWAEAGRPTLFEGDDGAIEAARLLLVKVRVELHRLTGKAFDVLLLQDQDAVASRLDYPDADALMAAVATAARTVAWRADEAWSRVHAAEKRKKGRPAPTAPAGRGMEWRHGDLELAADADPAGDPELVLRAAATAAMAGARLGRQCLDRLAAEAVLPGEPWSGEARAELVRLLSAGRAAISVLESLDQAGLLVRLIPEWSAVHSRPQRNAYHRFTVDRHLCEAAAGAALFADQVTRPDLLLVGTLLHDIGKGFVPELGNDHSVTGAEVMRRVASRMGFPPADVEVLTILVRHHLLLADAATRRDISDPATIETVISALGDVGTLHLLHALTEADSLATGPAAWSPWKAGLVTELVTRAARAMAGEAAASVPEFPGPTHAAALARAREAGEVVVDGNGHWVTVVAPDRPGLFSRVAGTLTLQGLDVLSARAWSGDDGTAVEELRVEPVFAGEPDWSRFETDLAQVLSGRISLEARVAERARTYAGSERRTAAETARTSVTVHGDASERSTVVEVRAPDRLGTLYRITRALADLQLDIRHAKVSTVGHEVVDVFYVVDASGSKLDDDHAAEVERAVLLELSRV